RTASSDGTVALKPGTPAAAGSASGVCALDVVIDETLECGRELVVRAPKRGHVRPVDVDRTARLLARARQTDADARRLRLAGAVDDAAHHRERHAFHTLVGGLPLRHSVADVALDPFGQLLKGRARGPAAARARGDARRERSEAERLQQFAGRVHLFAPLAAPP